MSKNTHLKKILYLGPKGSYSDLAKNKFKDFCEDSCIFSPIDSIYQIFKLLEEDSLESTGAVVPIENSIEGVVRETQDNLKNIYPINFKVLAETKIKIEHSLIGFANNIDEISEVISHSQALSQCRNYIYNNLRKDIILTPTVSTSLAASSLTLENKSIAAIANAHCANLYNIPILVNNINDEPNNSTRFILLSKIKPKKNIDNKISIRFSTINKSGALKEILDILDEHDLNMSYIDSRPSRKELGEYVFYVDFAGHIEDSNVFFALAEIQKAAKEFYILSEGAEIIA